MLTDVAITLFSLLTLWTLVEMWRQPNRAGIVKFALAFAGALLSKFSAGLLLFCFLTFALSLRFKPTAEVPIDKLERRRWRGRRFWALVKGMVLALGVVYAVYFILTLGQPTDSFSVIPHFPASLVLRRLLMPVWMYLRGLLGFAASSTRPTFILGHSYQHGVWFYFPVLFFLKSQTAFIALLALAAATVIAAKVRSRGMFTAAPQEFSLHGRAIWIFFVVFTLASILSPITISIRHFSVPLAMLILMLASLPRAIASLAATWPAARFIGWAAGVLALTLAVVATRIYPNYFPYLSAFGMGRPGYELMNDSNLDWNHALPEVERFAEQRKLKHVLIDEYGFSKPQVYIHGAQFWNCQEPTANDAGQWAVVSAGMLRDGHNCPWLLNYPHQPIAGGSMYAFQLPQTIPAQGTPEGPLPPDQWHNWAGFPWKGDIRLVFLNCLNDPTQMQPTFDSITAQFTAMVEEQKRKKKK